METSLMSESLVDESDVEETVTQVIKQFVEDGDEETVMSVEFLQEKVELYLGYLSESLSRDWSGTIGVGHIQRLVLSGKGEEPVK